MVIRTFFDKNNTIVNNDLINTGRNPVTELFYGGADGENEYSRYLFHFDETRLVSLYSGGTFTDLSKLKHTLKLYNTASFDEGLLNTMMASKDRASSFDLIVFKVNQLWDEGVGYDYIPESFVYGNSAVSTQPSNWIYAQTAISWSGGSGVYSGTSTNIIATQHFDAGNENIEIDITNYVNGLLTGDTNYGLGIAFSRPYELISTRTLQYVGFFTRHTQTFYEPYVESVYTNYITDDRNNFYLDKVNKLYLYVNLGGTPTNLDTLPSVDIIDNNGALFSAYSTSDVTHVTKGVYSIDILVPTTNEITSDYIFNDVWSGIVINGISRPDLTLDFALRNSSEYYNIGNVDMLPRKVGLSVSGIRSQEKIKRGDVKKIIVSTRIPYTVEQSQHVTNMKYRLYVKEGNNELTVVDFHPIERATNYNYFLLDTESLIPNTYYLDILVESNLEATTIKNAINFDIVSESNLRSSQ